MNLNQLVIRNQAKGCLTLFSDVLGNHSYRVFYAGVNRTSYSALQKETKQRGRNRCLDELHASLFWFGSSPSFVKSTLKLSIRVTNAFLRAALHRMFQHLPVKLNGGRANFCKIKSRQKLTMLLLIHCVVIGYFCTDIYMLISVEYCWLSSSLLQDSHLCFKPAITDLVSKYGWPSLWKSIKDEGWNKVWILTWGVIILGLKDGQYFFGNYWAKIPY